MTDYPSLASTLRQHGFSSTASRQQVFDVLQAHEALTMHELVEACPHTDRASVYRSVELFEKLGIAQRLYTGWKYKIELTDLFHRHHHHATCVQCGQTIVLAEDFAIERQVEALAQSINFQLENHQLELRGYCDQCSTHS